MDGNKRAARAVGLFYILAAVSSILGGLIFYQPILGPDYLTSGAANANQVLLGAVMELILVVSAVGTAVGLFPFLRKHGESIALGFLCLRFLEAVLITVGILSVLSLLSLSQAFVATGAPDAAAFTAVGTALLAVHKWTFMLGPNFALGVNTFLYSYLLYKSGLVPRPLAGLGLAGGALIFVGALLELFGVFPQLSVWGALVALPVFAFEMSLAVWLIAKGFNLAPTALRRTA